MIRPWHLGPLLASVALGGSAYWWHAKKDGWQPPPARLPDVPKVEVMPNPVRASAKQALERPLLWSSRRVVETEDKKTGQVQELMQSRLMAVLESGQERVAVLQRKDGSIMKITAETKPWRLGSFDGRKALFVSADKQQVERLLESGSPPPQGGPARPRIPPGTP